MAEQEFKLESVWTRRSGLLALVIGILAFAVNLTQDIFLASEGFSRWTVVIISDLITGGIAGALFYQFAKYEKYKRELIRARMHTIAELNHHIRNALQVIKFWGLQHQNCSLDEIQIQFMKDSVDRIEWALREILPSYGPELAQSGSAPHQGIAPTSPARELQGQPSTPPQPKPH
ncbi:MAG TPA: hypothetical protein VJN64_06640 [Terriglobales bacterium]|nr:hypothetical protein [Terriglobales bacterium]